MAEKELKLKVAEAIQDDVNKGIVRIDSGYLSEVEIKAGDIVEIEGERKTVAIADRSYPGDIGLNIIRMDGIIRKNSKTGIGEIVKVRKAQIKEAKKIIIAPARKGIVIRASPEIFKQGLLGRAVVKGDVVSLGGARRRKSTMMNNPFFDEDIFSILDESMMGIGFGDIKFVVIDTNPKAAVLILDSTEIEFRSEAVEIEEERVPDITYEDVGGLEDEIKKVREMVELPLKHPEIFERLGIEAPKGVLLHGPPGTGKTLLAKAVANETNSHFILINGPEVMCVDGDTKILTNPKGNVKAKDIFNNAEKDGKIQGEKIKVIELKKPINTFAFKDGKISKAKITHVTKLKAPSYEVQLSDGNVMTVSSNQPFLIYENGNLVWKRMEQLKEGNLVAKLNQFNVNGKSYRIIFSIRNLVRKGNLYTITSRNLSRSNWIRLPRQTSPELMEFLGLVMSDGNIDKNKESVTFCNIDPNLLDRFKKLSKNLFSVKTLKEYQDGRVVIYSKLLAEFISSLGIDSGRKESKIPAYMYKLPKKEIESFIRGYFDGDGCVAMTHFKSKDGKESAYPTPKIFCKSREFLQELQSLMQLRLGISTKLNLHNTPKGMMHELVVRGHEGRKKFLSIGSSSVKMEKIIRINLNRKTKEFEKIPTPSVLVKSIKERMMYKDFRNNDYYIYGGGTFSRYSLNKLFNLAKKYGNINANLINEFNILSRKDIGWEQIKKISFAGERDLYDFTVDKDSFTTQNLLLLHNSKYYGQSLPYDEKILIIENNLIKRVPIGEVVENNNKNLKVVCFDEKGKVRISKITGLIKHKNNSKILKIKTRSGRSIRVTDYHSVFAIGKNGVEDIKTSDLIPNKSFIAVPKKLPFAENTVENLDLLEILKENDHGLKVRGVQHYIKEAINRIGHGNAADILGIKSKYLYDVLCKNVGISVSKFVGLMKEAKIRINHEDIKICTKGKSLPSILEFNEDFCAFLGLWVAEGSYTNKNEVRLSIHRKEEKAVKELCNKLFGPVTIYHKPNFHATDIYICSGILGAIMKKVLGFNSNARQKKIPNIVYNFNRQNLAAFLRGYFSGDGSLNTKTPAPMVEACTESHELADDIAHLLLYFGIVAKIYSRKDRPQKRICFADYENLNNFREIGFFDSERNLAIYHYLSKIGVSRRDRIPISGEIRSIVESNHYLKSWQNQESIGKNILLRLKNPKMEQILNSDIYWDKVIDVQEVKGEFEYVYDISVEPCQNFIAGFGGIFAHNSEENLRKKFEEAEKNAPSIIFIDEVDAIASKREETRGEVERRVVAQLLALMDGLQSRGKVVVIAATNVPNILDPALRRPGRFDREIEIGVPSKEGRLNILKIHTRNMPMYSRENLVKESDFEPEYKEAILNLLRYKDANSRSIERTINKYLVENPEKNDLFKKIEISKLKKYMEKINYDMKVVHLKELAEITHGFVGADLSSLAKEAAMIVLRKVLPDIKLKEDEPLPKELLEKLVITQHDFKEALKVVRPSALREVLVEIPNIKWTDIGGLENIKQELVEAVEWPLKHPEAFKRLGVRPPRGILLYGAPGSGKTLLAKAVANESEANFISVKGPELLSMYVGESEKAVRQIFKKARQVSPCIIFFDEVDALAPRRGASSDSHVSERVVNQLLTEIDGLEDLHDVVVIAATNRPDIVDTALLRPGRFDRMILTPIPEEKSRFEIFKVHTKGMPISVEVPAEKLKGKKMLAAKTKEGTSIEYEEEKPIFALSGIKTKDDLLMQLAKKTEGYVGADIEAVCREAAILALREDIESRDILPRHFEKTLDKVRPSVTKDVEKYYEELREQLTAARAKQMLDEKPGYMG